MKTNLSLKTKIVILPVIISAIGLGLVGYLAAQEVGRRVRAQVQEEALLTVSLFDADVETLGAVLDSDRIQSTIRNLVKERPEIASFTFNGPVYEKAQVAGYRTLASSDPSLIWSEVQPPIKDVIAKGEILTRTTRVDGQPAVEVFAPLHVETESLAAVEIVVSIAPGESVEVAQARGLWIARVMDASVNTAEDLFHSAPLQRTITNLVQEQPDIVKFSLHGPVYLQPVVLEYRQIAGTDPQTVGELSRPETVAPIVTDETVLAMVAVDGEDFWHVIAPIHVDRKAVATVELLVSLDRARAETGRIAQVSTLTTLTVIALMIALLIVALSRIIIRPISQLTASAQAMAGGDLLQEVAISSKDEIGVLANAFNSMQRQLRELIGTLEQRVTELKRTQDTLQDSEARYRTLFDGVPVSLYRTTPAGQFLDANLAMVRTLGYPDRESLMTTTADEIYLDPADRERWKVLMERAGVVHDFEFQARRYDGTTIWANDTASLVKDEQGRVLCYEGRLEDITGRKRAETERERLLAAEREQRRFAESLRRTGAALSSILDYDAVLDRILEQVGQVVPHDTATIMLVEGDQAQVFRMLGYERFGTQAFVASITFDIADVPIFQRMRETGRPLVVPHTERDEGWVYSSPDHAWIQSYAGAPIRIRDQVVGFLNVNSTTPNFFDQSHAEQLQAFADQAAIAIENARLYHQAQEDLGERIRAESELREYQEHLEELVEERTFELVQATREAEEARRAAEAANRAKSTFLTNMSHELRTPLNAILGYAQLMGRGPHLTPTQQEYLETIARSGEHLLGLINDVLTMSKIEAGRTTLQENAFDLHWLLHSLQETFQLRAADKGLALRLDIAPDVPRYVHADEGKLRQVLMNLLSNAVKFTEAGSVTLRVEAQIPNSKRHTQSTGHCVWAAPTPSSAGSLDLEFGVWNLAFAVEDTGVGIAPAEMDALFDPFVQTASGQRSQGGTGLGLPISRQFVELMGGELGATSVVGQGTTFRARIPVTIVDAAAVQALDWQPRRRVTGIEPGQTAPDGGSFRLLVVEDKASNREVLIKLLASFGFDVRAATNGAEGVELWETWQPHLVWMDMRMPVLDGYEATRQIKARAAVLGRPTIVVALTASAFEEDRQAILAAGCDDFVRKPFREDEVFDVLRRHLGVRFIYEAAASAPEAAARASLADLGAAVEALPAAWAADLYQATVALDIDQMQALVESVRPQAPHLADTLAQWVRDFEYEKLLALIAPGAAPQT